MRKISPKNKEIKILLVVPRYQLTNKISYNYVFPLGLGYISSVIKRAGYDVDCLNLNHHNGTVKEVMTRGFRNKKYDFVLTGNIGGGYPIMKKIIEAVRDYDKNIKIVLGGAIITSEPELMINSLKPDCGVMGEGEETIIELLDAMINNKPLEKINGIVYKDKNNKLIITPERKPIMDIDSLPLPDFEGFEFEKQLENMYTNENYYQNQFDYPRTYPILASRSCPFQCTFCYHSIGSRYRERSIKAVMQELKYAIEKYKINCIAIYDDLFSCKKERLYDFCSQLKEFSKKIPWKIKWTCQLSVRDVDEDLLKVMKDAGCDIISYGFESFSPIVLKSMNKPITPEQIDSALKKTLAARISVQANFIFGDIAETRKTAYHTLNYWAKNCFGQIGLYFIQPYPGSKIYNYCIEKGLIKDKLNFIENEIGKEVVINMTENMTDAEIKMLVEDIVKFKIKYEKYIKPISTKSMGNKRYEINIKCPYCKEKMRYRNFYMKNPYFYESNLICRNCNMRFNVIGSLKKLTRDYYWLVYPAKKYYGRISHFLNKMKI